MRVLLVRHKEEPKVVNIHHTLLEMQQLVDGNIEIVEPFDDNIALVCSENGRSDGKPLNCVISSYLDIYGDFFLCKYGESELEDLPEEKTFKYASMFRLPRNRDTSAIDEENRLLFELFH